MPLSTAVKTNFEMLRQAFENGDVALMECTRLRDMKKVPVLCAVQHPDNTGAVEFVPFAEMVAGEKNPYDLYVPPRDEEST